MYLIKVRKTTENDLKQIGKAKDINEAFKILRKVQNIEEVYLRYYELERELEY